MLPYFITAENASLMGKMDLTALWPAVALLLLTPTLLVAWDKGRGQGKVGT